VNFRSLIEMIETNDVCQRCGSDLYVNEETVGIATSVVMTIGYDMG
jgi:uncharacterized protein (DUF983 family)